MSLRDDIIKLGHQHPELRQHLGPILRAHDKKVASAVRRKQARPVTTQDVVTALRLISHNLSKVKVEDWGPEGPEVVVARVSKQQVTEMARAYVDNHLEEQFGRAQFAVDLIGNDVLIAPNRPESFFRGG